jgi:hypothetical protein
MYSRPFYWMKGKRSVSVFCRVLYLLRKNVSGTLYGSVVVEALLYKPEGLGFDSR